MMLPLASTYANAPPPPFALYPPPLASTATVNARTVKTPLIKTRFSVIKPTSAALSGFRRSRREWKERYREGVNLVQGIAGFHEFMKLFDECENSALRFDDAFATPRQDHGRLHALLVRDRSQGVTGFIENLFLMLAVRGGGPDVSEVSRVSERVLPLAPLVRDQVAEAFEAHDR